MSDWWKNITAVFARPGDEREQREQAASLRGQLDREKQKLRAVNASGTSKNAQEAAAWQEELRVLRSLVGWKLGVQVKDLAGNPSKIDGYWFGVQPYVRDTVDSNGGRDFARSWKLYFFRQCPQCRHLFPTLELGDYAEAEAATQNLMAGEEAGVVRSTEKLAAYLNDLEQNKPDEHCPRHCPNCSKLLRGGTK